MKIPKTLKIGGHIYKILFPYVFTERYDINGNCDADTCLIKIAASNVNIPRAESAIAVTFIHEVLHAIDFNTGHRIFERTEGEKKIEALSEGIYQVLVDNNYLKE